MSDMKVALTWRSRLQALPSDRARLARLVEMHFPPRAVLAAKYPRIGQSHWWPFLYAIHWTRPPARVLRVLLTERRRLRTWRELDRAAQA